MEPLNSSQKKYLRGLAHPLKPCIFIGKEGVTETLTQAVDEALETHELIKLKFNDHKEQKTELLEAIVAGCQAGLAGVIGHIAILYRPRKDADKRLIHMPN